MAETTTLATAHAAGRDANTVAGAASSRSPNNETQPTPAGRASPKPPLSQIYVLPAPIRTFPLPTFYPNNPISLLHLVYAWLCQVFRPPPCEPSVVHVGVWDAETRSVHVRDPTSIRALWEQGFYGKGSLSRSEPNWLKRELARRGSPEGKTVSEARTELRREERRLAKWERAKTELEAIERQRLAEAAARATAAEPNEANGVLDKPVGGSGSLPFLNGAGSSVTEPTLTDATAETAQESSPITETSRLLKLQGSAARCAEGFKAPVGPAELLALPNSLAKPRAKAISSGCLSEPKPPVGPAELLLLPNSPADLALRLVKTSSMRESGERAMGQSTLQAAPEVNGHTADKAAKGKLKTNGVVNDKGHPIKASALAGNQKVGKLSSEGTQPDGVTNGAVSPRSIPSPNGSATEANGLQALKRRKSVRFSPTVESTTFLHSDPPSPNRSANASSKGAVPASSNGQPVKKPVVSSTVSPVVRSASESASGVSLDSPSTPTELENKEHFQLAPEEAFFLVFSLGALRVVDPVTGSPIPTERLLSLFRSYSYFPPRSLGSGLGADDPFLVNYAVYHRFRSLGWVPRHGIKFGVDWILYQRGPVFDHSEFGIMVLPSYSHPAWEEHKHEEPKRSWSWLMGVNRVLSHVLKSLVLVYVDIPPPTVFAEEMQRGGIAAALKKYTIREVIVRRFSVNRNR
ncbi:hypothetical protein C8A03DRAFT_19320 [Achaetomium macrosporum]|uniref:tRNA-intron lyase n=1 Tax=Achaetomium macrosporum TaxID=79813 RepID=A0AAN7H791_9PEZI|nr:hypothetical protein C8A03DRAFT_19320 [Achaetomium macrosporum]